MNSIIQRFKASTRNIQEKQLKYFGANVGAFTLDYRVKNNYGKRFLEVLFKFLKVYDINN